MTIKTTVTFELPAALKNKVTRKAKKEGMSMSFFIRQALKEAVERQK